VTSPPQRVRANHVCDLFDNGDGRRLEPQRESGRAVNPERGLERKANVATLPGFPHQY
jgi:hypothetical protein